jgi:inward rectifier potassium channel
MEHWRLRSFQKIPARKSFDGSDLEDLSEQKRKVVCIDGTDVEFELVKSVTDFPETSVNERPKIQFLNTNLRNNTAITTIENQVKRVLMGYNWFTLTVLYLLVFVTMNAIFAGLLSIEQDRCCEDPEMTFAQLFDFAVQTSTTIGYGGYWPRGYFANFLVVVLSILALLNSTVYAGLIFFKFVTPEANIQFSEVITYSNVKGVPCLEIRVGNADGISNVLLVASASLSVSSVHRYTCPDDKEVKTMGQTEELKLNRSNQHTLSGVWTIRHFITEESPLYGYRFDEFPGDTIQRFHLCISVTQALTNGEVHKYIAYETKDVLIGHRFQDQIEYKKELGTITSDYGKMNKTLPAYVWYPVSKIS